MKETPLSDKYSDGGNYSGGSAVEGTHFNYETDGNGMRHRIFNFKNEELCPRKGIIELRAIYDGTRHENWTQLSKVYDNVNDIMIGIPTKINNKTKELEFKKITMRDREVLDLSNYNDAMKWAVIKHSHYIEGSKKAGLGGTKPKYRVYDKEREAELFISKRAVKRKAEGIAEGLMGEQLVEMARNLGLDITLMSPTVMSMAVIKEAERVPKQFMDIWDSPDRYELTILKRAIANGVVIYDPHLGYTYGSLPLGVNEPQALQYLKDNIQTRQVIDMASKKNEVESVKSMSTAVANPIKDEKDSEIALLRQQLEDMKNNLQKVSSAKIEETTENVLANFNETDDDFLAIKEEARRLKIPGWAVTKDKEILRQKVKDRIAEINAKG